jgi:hypothetical protein
LLPIAPENVKAVNNKTWQGLNNHPFTGIKENKKMNLTFVTLFSIMLATQAAVDYARPPGMTLCELAQSRRFHIGANFPKLYEKWNETGKFGPRYFNPEAAIAKVQFTIMTAGWEVFPGNTWKREAIQLCRFR